MFYLYVPTQTEQEGSPMVIFFKALAIAHKEYG